MEKMLNYLRNFCGSSSQSFLGRCLRNRLLKIAVAWSSSNMR